MTTVTTRDQFLNILAFLILIDGTGSLDKAPDYVIEKWDRYIRAAPPDGPAWRWGLDMGNMGLLDAYVDRWKFAFDELFPTNEEGSDISDQ